MAGQVFTDHTHNGGASCHPVPRRRPWSRQRAAASAEDLSIDPQVVLVNTFLAEYASKLMSHLTHRTFPATLPRAFMAVLVMCCLNLIAPTGAQGQAILVPDVPAPSMSIEDIRIGMTGYGMTVFHGTKIEPFNVVVVSVIPNSVPGRSVIWVRCDDPRMVTSGPVQGMSGSPIYLWGEDEPKELGKGGKLIGAFAFGYSESKVCMVGVQPIEYMRESATRAHADDDAAGAGRRGASTQHVIEMLDRIEQMPQTGDDDSVSKVRLRALRNVLLKAGGKAVSGDVDYGARRPVSVPSKGAMVSPMMLPISLGSSSAVELFAPLVEPMGLLGVASQGGAVSGAPPHGIDPATTMIQPGSVLAIPLASGDMDLSATGTVTDVLPGGEVLGFGHPMFGLGESNVPMATGYVHFVMPRASISFKSSGTLTPLGTLVRDEGAGVVGIDKTLYTSADVEVTVNMPGLETQTYRYQVVNEPQLSAMLTASVIFNSIEAIYGTPSENTIHTVATMRFTGGREFTLDSLVAGASAANPVMEMLTPLSIMTINPYEQLDIESVKVNMDIEYGNRLAHLVGAQLERSEVAPGQTVTVLLELQHYEGPLEKRRIEVQIPADLEEGDYPLTVSGSNTYASLKIGSQPHLATTENIDDLAEYIQATMNFRYDAIYSTIMLPENGIAYGRTEMADLPSSRAAMLTSPTNTQALPLIRLIDQTFDSDVIVLGQAGFTLNVRKP